MALCHQESQTPLWLHEAGHWGMTILIARGHRNASGLCIPVLWCLLRVRLGHQGLGPLGWGFISIVQSSNPWGQGETMTSLYSWCNFFLSDVLSRLLIWYAIINCTALVAKLYWFDTDWEWKIEMLYFWYDFPFSHFDTSLIHRWNFWEISMEFPVLITKIPGDTKRHFYAWKRKSYLPMTSPWVTGYK